MLKLRAAQCDYGQQESHTEEEDDYGDVDVDDDTVRTLFGAEGDDEEEGVDESDESHHHRRIDGGIHYDYVKMQMPSRALEFMKTHALYGTLLGEHRIERYDVYKRKRKSHRRRRRSSKKSKLGLAGDESRDVADDGTVVDNQQRHDDDHEEGDLLVAIVKFGNRLDGHPTVVHGGILSLVLDDVFGMGFEAIGVTKAVTANLTVDYRSPVPAGSRVLVRVQLRERVGRKLYWSAQMTDVDRKVLYVESTSLYIIPRDAVAAEAEEEQQQPATRATE